MFNFSSSTATSQVQKYYAGQDPAFAQPQYAKCFWQNNTKFESLAAALKFSINTVGYFRVEGGLV